MRRQRFAILLLLLSLSVSAVRAETAEAAANPLPNPGFENGDAGWAIRDTFSRVTADAAHEGKAGLRIAVDASAPTGSSVSSPRFPVAPGQELTLSFWGRTQTSFCGVYFFFHSQDGKVLTDPAFKAGGGHPVCGIKNTDGAWHAYTLQAKAPPEAAAVSLWIHSYGNARGTVDLDDFALAGLAAGAAPLAMPAAKPRPAPAVPATLPPREKPPVIILKLDDVKAVRGDVPGAWKKVAAFLAERRIKAGFGVICETLQDTAPDSAYVKWLKAQHDSGLVEFWFHGWDHGVHEESGVKYNEFNHRPYAEQKERFDKSQKLAKEKLGFAFQTFGPPGGTGNGSFDAETCRVMQDEPDMKVWLYPQPLDTLGKELAAKGKVVILDRVWAVNLEGAVGMPDYARFVAGYAANPQRKYFVLQGHPMPWVQGDRFAEFVKIIDFLVEQKAVFMTPSEYAATVGKGAGRTP